MTPGAAGEPGAGRLTIALPKGRLLEPALALLARAGVEVDREQLDTRRLWIDDRAGRARLLLVKPGDVPVYVEHGTADLGVCGGDVLRERGGDVLAPLDLGFGRCRLVVAGPPGALEATAAQAATRVATKYPRTATRFFLDRGRPVEVVPLSGSVELAPVLGLAHVIVDLVETGRTLAENGLEVLEEVEASTARLVVNRAAWQLRGPDVQALVAALRAARDAGSPAGAGPAAGGSAAPASAGAAPAPAPRPAGSPAEGLPGADAPAVPVVPWAPGELPPRLAAILERGGGPSPEVLARTAALVERVRREGNAALLALGRELDGVDLTADRLEVRRDELEALAAGVDPAVRGALERAAASIRAFHERQRREGLRYDDGDGVDLGLRVLPLARAGLYVPGGTAAYPSSVLMNALPARVAGVDELVAVTPPRALERTPALAAALLLAGVDRTFRIGGAQAVAALAYGTESVPRVDKIVGPGNLWVATAKRLVFGQVGIDSFAGPSEVVVVCDATADPAWVAADLLAQAEHDVEAAAIAITWDAALARAIAAEAARQVALLPRRETAAASLARFGAVFLVPDLEAALALTDRLAAEHVELCVRDPEAVAARVRHAGALFLGAWSPEAVGDYLAGPNHVLPTAGTARWASGLGVDDFVRRTSLIRYSEARLARTGDDVVALARAEGLEAHARSVLARQGRLPAGPA